MQRGQAHLQAVALAARAQESRQGAAVARREREEQRLAYWIRPSEPMVSGEVSADDIFEFDFRSVVQVIAADPSISEPGCVLEQHESIALAPHRELLGPDAQPAEDEPLATGENIIELTPVPGSRCERATVLGGGPFTALPCSIEYELTAYAP